MFVPMIHKGYYVFNFLKLIGASSIFTGTSILGYKIHQTIEHIKGVVNTNILKCEKKTVSYIYLEDEEIKETLELYYLDKDGYFKPKTFACHLFLLWRDFWQAYAMRLMSMATCSEPTFRVDAVEKLGRCRHLCSAGYSLLAQKCDALTAVGLARIKHSDKRLFARKLPRQNIDKQILIGQIRDILVELNKKGEHECLTYFLSKTFPGFHNDKGTFFDIEVRGKIRQPAIYNEDVLPRCVKELVHYCSIEDNSLELVKLGGLKLMMDIYNHLGSEMDMEFVKLIERISVYPECLQHTFYAGWISILAEWSKHSDKRLSARAIHALVNLDTDDKYHATYGPQMLLLHPPHRKFVANDCVDVVFVHGLLGGALVTWRQREVNLYRLSFYDLQSPQATNEPPQKKRIINTSDTNTKKYINTLQDLKEEEWDKLGEDYEFVLCDFPTSMNNMKEGLSVSGDNYLVKKCVEEESTSEFSSCWPQDWLAKDFPNTRILCVNYDTRLSDWQFTCLKQTKRDIESIADSLLSELVTSGVGSRPIVWVVHSMGGLIVKSMIIKAWQKRGEQYQAFHKNTKGIVFLSTPHFGSQIATMFDSHRIILWPSNEVDDLRVNSSYLEGLHRLFVEWLKKVPQKIVTIAETKPTQLTGLGFWVEFLFVTQESADPGFGDVYYLPYDHVNICKPSNRLSFIYKKVLEVVQNATLSCNKS